MRTSRAPHCCIGYWTQEERDALYARIVEPIRLPEPPTLPGIIAGTHYVKTDEVDSKGHAIYLMVEGEQP